MIIGGGFLESVERMLGRSRSEVVDVSMTMLKTKLLVASILDAFLRVLR